MTASVLVRARACPTVADGARFSGALDRPWGMGSLLACCGMLLELLLGFLFSPGFWHTNQVTSGSHGWFLQNNVLWHPPTLVWATLSPIVPPPPPASTQPLWNTPPCLVLQSRAGFYFLLEQMHKIEDSLPGLCLTLKGETCAYLLPSNGHQSWVSAPGFYHQSRMCVYY